jgi:hypothetical protein
MSFNVQDYMINLKGKPYLPVAGRIGILRFGNPELKDRYSIKTTPLQIDMESGFAIFQAEIWLDGVLLGMGTKQESKRDFPDFLEKAETGAIGRALAVAGFGTLYALQDFDEGERLADAPVHINKPAQNMPVNAPAKPVQAGKDEYKQLARDLIQSAGYEAVPDNKVGTVLKELFAELLPEKASAKEWPAPDDMAQMKTMVLGT